ncbi:MAG TPA: HlyD family secretion protein [Porticoccaceae bacterium]|jgi:HlyD family secretion protein|nr:HlyD family secretion protein [Porticoccaceae bacterium]
MKKIRLLIMITLTIQACQPPVIEAIQQSGINITVSASGELESTITALISPPAIKGTWNYQIKYLIAENTPVKKGALLVSFDDKEVNSQLEQQQAELSQVRQELANKIIQETATEKKLLLAVAEMQMNFDKALRTADIIDQSLSENDKRKVFIDFTIAKNDLYLAQEKIKFHKNNQQLNLRLAQGKIDRATIKVSSLKQDINKLKIKAPIDGIVIYRSNWRGEKLAVGESVSFGRPILEVAVLDQMQLTAQIAEVDSGKIRVGQTVDIKLDSVQGQTFKGKIISLGGIFREKSRQDKRRICDVIIAFDKTNSDIMRPGMTARVEVIITPRKDLSTTLSKSITQSNDAEKITISGLSSQPQKFVEISHIVSSKSIIFRGLNTEDKVLL